VGEVEDAGQTVAELSAHLTSRYDRIHRGSHVLVAILEVRSRGETTVAAGGGHAPHVRECIELDARLRSVRTDARETHCLKVRAPEEEVR
jgi:hypothetical protein